MLKATHWRPYAALIIGVLAVSTAAIFIRFAQEADAPSLLLAAARLTVASLVLTPIVLHRYRSEVRQLSRGEMRWAGVSGVVLGLHFATWITSLEYTSVVNSVVLVATAPLWVAVMAPLVLHERLGKWAVAGLGLAVSGGILVGLSGKAGDPPTRNVPMLGNGLALIGAGMAAVYFVIGKRLRARISVMVYVWLVYSVAATTLVIAVILSGTTVWGLPGKAYLWMLLMGLIPQLIGHSSFNYALGFLPAAYVSLVVLGEPIGSGLLAIIFLGEWPGAWQVVGSGLILMGILASSREQQNREIELSD